MFATFRFVKVTVLVWKVQTGPICFVHVEENASIVHKRDEFDSNFLLIAIKVSSARFILVCETVVKISTLLPS